MSQLFGTPNFSCPNARAAEFQKKKQKEEAEKAKAAGKEKTARKEEEEAKDASKEDKEAEEVEESEMMISSLDSSPESRKFSFASPIQETLRHDTSQDISMIPDEERDETRQDETEVHKNGQHDKVDSLNDFINEKGR